MNSRSGNGVYSPETLATVHRVLDDSFTVITRHYPVLDEQSSDELRVRLASVLMSALEGGIVQANLLKEIAIGHVASNLRMVRPVD